MAALSAALSARPMVSKLVSPLAARAVCATYARLTRAVSLGQACPMWVLWALYARCMRDISVDARCMRAVCATYVFSASNADMCMCALCALYARLMRAVMFGFVFLYEAALLHEVCSMRVVCATYARCGFFGSFSLESLRSLCAPYACLMRAVALQCAPYACCMRHLSALLSLTVAQCARFKVRLTR